MLGTVAIAGGALVDVPLDGVSDVLVFQCPDVLGQLCLVGVFPVFE